MPEKATIIESPSPMKQSIPLSGSVWSQGEQGYQQNHEIHRARNILMILIGIKLILAVIYFIREVVNLAHYLRLDEVHRDGKHTGIYASSVVVAGLSLIYLIIFAAMVIKYIRIGILIFAWLGLIELILVILLVILLIVGAIIISAASHAVAVGIVASIIIIIIATISCLLTILIVIYAFKLARLIKAHDGYQSV